MFNYLYLFIFAIAPGLIWLFYFIEKDKHPEPKRMILKIFFLGMAVALPAAFLELLFQKLPFQEIAFSNPWENYIFVLLQVTLGVALIEEMVKYAVVRFAILKSSELDEPIDLMMYMIVSALGFATLENCFYFLSPEILSASLKDGATLSAFRFISATFLHALTSGTIGFFLALSFCQIKRKRFLFPAGFGVAVLLHALYNFSIMNLEGCLRFEIPIMIIFCLALFVYCGIRHLKSIKGICKIN
jgi:protease PrsW